MDNDKMQITALDFSFAINKAYERGLTRGLMGHIAKLSLDEVMRQNPALYAELDRRIGKALTTARAKWEASLKLDAEIEPIPGEPEAAEPTDVEGSSNE